MTASPGDRDLTGGQLGPYALEALIGEGAFGRVYRARHIELNVPRAVKVMHYALAGDRRFQERFLREARTAARLDHPNIVTVHDFAADSDVRYLVMEYVDSLTLAERLNHRQVAGRLYDAVVQSWIRDVATALDYAHGLGIVHRDLKPANVLIRSRDQRAMLTDFGIAQALDEPSLTLTGVAMGTYAYMAPEQARGASDLTAAVDVYAFAAMLVEIATGEPPFGRGLAAVGGHLGSPVPTLDVLGPDIGDRVRAAAATGLAKDPADRVATAGELAEAFLRAAGERAPATAARGAPAATPPAVLVEATEPPAPVQRRDVDATVPPRWAAPAPEEAPAGAAPPAGPAGLLGRRRALLAAAAVAPLLIAGLVAVAVASTREPPTPIPEPPPAPLPSPVQATVGSSFIVSGLDVTVLSAAAGPPPSTLPLPANDRVIVLQVSCGADLGLTAIVSPYEWLLAESSGPWNTYQPVVEGIAGALPETTLKPGQTITGSVVFAVPPTEQGLHLRFVAEEGDESAEIAVPPEVLPGTVKTG